MIFSNKYILPFSIVAVALIVVIGSAFLLNQNSEPQQTPSPPPTLSPTPSSIPTVEVPADWKTYRNEEFGFEFRYPQSYTIEERGADYGLYVAVITPQTQALQERTLGEESDAMMIMPRLTPEFLNLFLMANPDDRSGRSLSLEEVIQGDFSFVHRISIGGRVGLQFIYPGPYASQEALKDTLLPNSNGTWFRVTWDTKFSNPYDLILSTFSFMQ